MNQRRIWNDQKVRAERQPAAEAKLGKPMEMEPPHVCLFGDGVCPDCDVVSDESPRDEAGR